MYTCDWTRHGSSRQSITRICSCAFSRSRTQRKADHGVAATCICATST